MFQKLLNHNPDIQQLVRKGFAVSFDSNHLLVRDIPYLDESMGLKSGAIVCKLNFVNNEVAQQHDHQIYFAGEVPYGLDGKIIPNLGGGPTSIQLSEQSKDVVVQRSFSNKPKSTGKYDDHSHKINSYVGMISGPAIQKYNATPFTHRKYLGGDLSGVFKYRDTLSSRAEITDISENLSEEVVAIIGLGGTGSYLLDFLVKSPVKEIRGFDNDEYQIHNAFRSPGRLDGLELGSNKADVYQKRYDNFREGLFLKNMFIDSSCMNELEGVTFVFVCIDSGNAKTEIFDLLIENNIPFIDVGMGLNRKKDLIKGMLRTTYFPLDEAKKVRDKQYCSEADSEEDIYKTNIQIGELNALNACLAIIQFKQLKSFYASSETPYNLAFTIDTLSSIKDYRLSED